jgi:hypothetical protein
VNGARGTRDIEGKATRVGASELGCERVSKPSCLSLHREFQQFVLLRLAEMLNSLLANGADGIRDIEGKAVTGSGEQAGT